MRNLAAPLLMLVLVTSVWLPIASGAATGVEWWGPTAIKDGHHIRFPVVVRNENDFAVTDAPAYAEIDIAQRLLAAGWIRRPVGGGDVLKSFELDLDSIRVVEVTDIQSASSGPSHGRLVTYDSARPPSDPRRYEVPSTVVPGALFSGDGQPFDPSTNPLVTVLWRVPGTMQPHASSRQERFFFVYLDTAANGDKQAPDYSASRGGGALAGLFWMGPGLVQYGNVAPSATEVATVRLVALEDNTLATVSTLSDAGLFEEVVPPTGFPSNPLTLQRMQPREAYVSTGHSTLFRVASNRPVLALVTGSGFVPGLNGALVAKDFVFNLNEGMDWEQDSVYFTALGTNETVVTVRPLAGGAERLFRLNTAQNEKPYTVGARGGRFLPADGSPACFVDVAAAPSPLLGPGYYRATVVGDPVLLQVAAARGMHQAPSRWGAPTGREFYASTGWTDFSFNHIGANPTCNDTSRAGSFIAGSVGEVSNLTVSSIDWVGQVYPQGRDPARLPAPAPIGAAPRGHDGPHVSPLLDRPLSFRATDPAWTFVGLHPPVGEVVDRVGFRYPDSRPVAISKGVPHVHGPVGGADLGRDFATFGPTAVVALFGSTSVEADLEYHSSGGAQATTELGAEGVFLLNDRADDDHLAGVRIRATRPSVVVPLGAPSGMLGGIPAMLRATPLDAEFRGYMVQVASPTGLNPVTDSTLPGTPIEYVVEVTNAGRGIGGANLADTIRLSVASPFSGWTAELDQRVIPDLQSGQTDSVRVTVTPSATLPAGSIGPVTVRATSTGNPNMTDDIQLVTVLKRSFAVGLWFDQVDNPRKANTRFMSIGETATYSLFLKNMGAVPDLIAVEPLEPDEPGWQVSVLRGAETVVEPLSMAAGEVVALTLRVEPPAAAAEGTLVTPVTATSVSEPAARDQVVAISKIRAASDVRLSTPIPVLRVDPGVQGLFPLVLKNGGLGAAELVFSLESPEDPSWNITRVFALDSQGEPTAPFSQLTLAPGEIAELRLGITADENSTAGVSQQIHLTIRIGGTSLVLEGILEAIVKPVHRMDQSLPLLPLLAAETAANLSVKVGLTNRGNLNESFSVRPADLPAGWRVEAAALLTVNRGQRQDLGVRIVLPQAVGPGAHNVSLRLVAKDGNVTTIRLPVLVGSVAFARVDPSDATPAQPGQNVSVPFPVRNEGNTPLKVSLVAAPAEPWTVDGALPSITLPPGAELSFVVRWRVPRDASDGTSAHTARLELRPSDPLAPTITKTLSALIAVGRPDLSFGEFRAFHGPGGVLVRGPLANQGDRPATNFTVELRVSGVVRDTVTIGELAPGSRANVTLLVADPDGAMTLVADAAQHVIETDEANNAAEVAPPSQGGGAPGPGALLLFAAVWIGFLVRGARIGRDSRRQQPLTKPSESYDRRSDPARRGKP